MTIPYQSPRPAARVSFTRTLHEEWIKFRTVRAWIVATIVSGALIILIGVLTGFGSHSEINGVAAHPYVPIGPHGTAVTDQFYLAAQPLAGNGTITARIASLTGQNDATSGSAANTPPAGASTPGPWAKAGLIIKQNTRQGSAYAAIMLTGGHGLRMQYDYTGDIAGPAAPTASPHWLRLVRTGQTISAYASNDGTTWTHIGTVRLATLTGTVQAGMFVASPARTTYQHQLGGGSNTPVGTTATATFDHLDLTGAAAAWTGTSVGAVPQQPDLGSISGSGGAYTVTGTGDIAPGNADADPIDHSLVGTFAALTVLAVLGVLFITSEYRRGLIRTSFTVNPRRPRLLAGKALILAAVTFVVGAVAAAITIPVGTHFIRAGATVVASAGTATLLRLVVGTGAVLALTAVLALAIGTMTRRSAPAVAVAVVATVLPYILATTGWLPDDLAEWLLRLTPAAGFAVQQSQLAYPQVDALYDPVHGYFPLTPWAGLAVLGAWTLVALVAAAHRLRTRDV